VNDTVWNDDDAWDDPLQHVGANQTPHQQVQQAPHQPVQQTPHQQVNPSDVDAAELVDWSCIPDFDEDQIPMQTRMDPAQPTHVQHQQADSADVTENMDWDHIPDLVPPPSPEKIVIPEGFDALQYLMHLVSIRFHTNIACLELYCTLLQPQLSHKSIYIL
jgi:hypothetical protein